MNLKTTAGIHHCINTEKVVKVIWHKTAAQPQTNGWMVFTR